MQIPGLTEQQITEMQRVVSVLIQKYTAFYGDEPEKVTSALTRVLNDLAQTTPDASLPNTEELITEFTRRHNPRSIRFSVVVAPERFGEAEDVTHHHKIEAALVRFQSASSEIVSGWVALIDNTARRVVGELSL